jgi:hypothetical protein
MLLYSLFFVPDAQVCVNAANNVNLIKATFYLSAKFSESCDSAFNFCECKGIVIMMKAAFTVQDCS